MKLRFFTVTVMDAQADQDSLNAFLANHRVVTLDKELVQRGAESFRAVCVGYSLGAIATTDNLALAAWKAVRGKRLRPDVVRFFSQADCSLAKLTHDIFDGRVPCGDYRAFTIHDPLKRARMKALDQMIIRPALQWRQKVNALRYASRPCAERLPKRRFERGIDG
jgi:hypothetical protein